MIALRARMVDSTDRTLVAGRRFEHAERASANRQSAIVAAFSEAAWRMSADVSDWAAEKIGRDSAPDTEPAPEPDSEPAAP